jgi:hypothetical protein
MGNIIRNNSLCNCSVPRKKTAFQVSAGTRLLSAIRTEEQIRERVISLLFCLVAGGSLPRSLH